MRIKNYFCRSLLVVCFLFLLEEVKAQVILQDSLALVALYNAQPLMGDSTWFQGNVSTWTGITVQGNRVVEFQVNYKVMQAPIPPEICGLDTLNFISLEYNQLTGLIPACIIDMSDLRHLGLSFNQLSGVEVTADFSHMNAIWYIGISDNEFREMPDFVSIASPYFEVLNARNNYFNLGDLLPVLDRIDTTYFTYDPQYLSPSMGMSANVGDTVNFPDASVIAGGTGNSYTWFKQDGPNLYPPPSNRFSGINESVLHLDNALLSDNGYYECHITNPRLPHLVYKTGFIVLSVVDPFLPQSITYQGDTMAYCGDSALVLSAVTTSGNPVSFVSLNNSLATVNPDNTLTLHRTGTVTLQATTPADATYHADTLWVDITVVSHVTPLPFLLMSIIESPSTGGKDLMLDIRNFPEFTYQWTLPNGQTFEGSALTVSPFTAADTGRYEIRVTEGTCLHSSPVYTESMFTYGKLVIYELITPNGDADNETFYIENLDPSIHNDVAVFNAAHQIVYHQENYRNDWDGGNLPVGTYYYFIHYGEQTYKGNLYIKR